MLVRISTLFTPRDIGTTAVANKIKQIFVHNNAAFIVFMVLIIFVVLLIMSCGGWSNLH